MESIPYKHCTKCGQEYPATSEYFYVHPCGKYGFRSVCRTCTLADNNAYAKTQRGREVLNRGYRKWANTEHGREMRREKRKRYSASNPVKERARSVVNRAVRSGVLPKVKTLTCVRCGQTAEQYHHHRGYEEQYVLDVVPLCMLCHKQVESLGGQGT